MNDQTRAAARLDFAEVLRSRWLVFCVGLYSLLAVIFIFVGLRESSVVGFTGTGRVLLSVCHGLTILLPLLALTATGQVINRARDDGTLELLFGHPFSRGDYFLALTLVRTTVLLAPLVVLVLLIALAGRAWLGSEPPWEFLGRSLLASAALIWAFTGIGLFVSVLVRHPARAVMTLLAIWVATVAFLDFALIGVMLQWRLEPRTIFFLAALNPVEGARLALLVAAEPSLSVLGPVGFYLAHRLGANWVTIVGIAWPLLVGTLSWAAARHNFVHGDLI